MFFVTDEPILFNAETGVMYQTRGERDLCIVEVIPGYQTVYGGNRQECEDFIYSIAGYVGAVNPVGKVTE